MHIIGCSTSKGMLTIIGSKLLKKLKKWRKKKQSKRYHNNIRTKKPKQKKKWRGHQSVCKTGTTNSRSAILRFACFNVLLECKKKKLCFLTEKKRKKKVAVILCSPIKSPNTPRQKIRRFRRGEQRNTQSHIRSYWKVSYGAIALPSIQRIIKKIKQNTRERKQLSSGWNGPLLFFFAFNLQMLSWHPVLHLSWTAHTREPWDA